MPMAEVKASGFDGIPRRRVQGAPAIASRPFVPAKAMVMAVVAC